MPLRTWVAVDGLPLAGVADRGGRGSFALRTGGCSTGQQFQAQTQTYRNDVAVTISSGGTRP